MPVGWYRRAGDDAGHQHLEGQSHVCARDSERTIGSYRQHALRVRCVDGRVLPPADTHIGSPRSRGCDTPALCCVDSGLAVFTLSWPAHTASVHAGGRWSQGARLAQDQVWAKPPGAGPLVFHRDSTYFDFNPADVTTVWLALDDMVPELGPLE